MFCQDNCNQQTIYLFCGFKTKSTVFQSFLDGMTASWVYEPVLGELMCFSRGKTLVWALFSQIRRFSRVFILFPIYLHDRPILAILIGLLEK